MTAKRHDRPFAVAAALLLAAQINAQAPAFNLQRPLQFYEMGRRQCLTDAACTTLAQSVAQVLDRNAKAAPQFVPVWKLRLGDALRAAGRDREAVAAYDGVLALPPGAPLGSGTAYSDLAGVQREAALNKAAVLARQGALAQSHAALAAVEPRSSRERVLAAEIRLLNRDPLADLLADIRADGHPERNWGHFFNPLRAAMLAHAAGEAALAERYAAPIAKRGEQAEKWPHWKSVWAQADQLARFSALGPLQTTQLRTGTYAGRSAGFYAPLEVEVKVAGGSLAAVRVTKQREDRPRNALDGFVKRLKGPDPLRVDAVTGATQTCHGVLLAVEDALRKAAPAAGLSKNR
jgi:uncharacterized protein with FMN-binding domain